MDFQGESIESWNQFLDQPGDLFADPLSLDLTSGTDTTPWESLPEPLLYEESLSWDLLEFRNYTTMRTPSSTGSTDESTKTVFLAAKDFVFSSGEETLADRVCTSLPPPPAITTGTPYVKSPAGASLERELKEYVEYQNRKSVKTECTQMTPKTTKRKQPEVDLETIADPEERKKQRRMAKNRRTAAVSRLRQKARLENLETQIHDLTEENQRLKKLLSHFIPLPDLLKSEENYCPLSDELAVLLTGLYLLAILQSNVVQKALWILRKILSISVIFNPSLIPPLVEVLTVKEIYPGNRSEAGLRRSSGVG